MQAEFKYGDPITAKHTPSSAVAAGDVLAIGDTLAIAITDIAADTEGVVALAGGIYTVTAGEAIATGKKVYWDDTNNKVVETATGNKQFGFVLPGDSASDDGDTLRILHWPDLSGSTPAATVAALTDSSGGTADGTLAAVGATNSGDVSGAINNNFADVAAKIAAILTALKNAGLMATS